MLTVIVLSIAIPGVIGATFLALHSRMPDLAADLRGIALQTVIIMVVLLAIAGAIAGVLLARGGEAVSDVERQQISRLAEDYSSEALCEAAGFTWNTSSTVCES